MGEKLLEVKNLTIGFPQETGMRTVVDDVSFTVGYGEIVGIVGESGSGKSMAVQTIMGLKNRDAHILSGEILFNGKDLLKMSDEALSKIQGNDMSMVFQEPMTSLNPVKKIGWQVAESLKIHTSMPDDEIHGRVVEILANVGLPKPEELCQKYPHQLSGGMRQRVMIAMALACDPDILIADEPTTALDVTIQAQIIELMQEMQEKNGNAIIMITHDLGVVADMADKIMVMYAGRPVEFGTAEEIFYESRHPYTWGLIRSIPEQAIEEKKPLTPIHGNPPSLMNLPEGCVFSPRCPYATDKCRKQRPERVVTESGHYSACHYSGDPEFLKNAPETSRTRKDSKKGGEA